MDRWCLLQLIQVLLITSCFCKDAELDCPDINATVGQSLNLNCTVTCEDCNSIKYKWKKDNTTLKHENSTEKEYFGSSGLHNHHISITFVALLTILALIGLAVFFRKYITVVFQRLQESLNMNICKKQNVSQGVV
ncbi:hypothetical protein SRHO_G00155320 [Serrasalmus rhombeus]